MSGQPARETRILSGLQFHRKFFQTDDGWDHSHLTAKMLEKIRVGTLDFDSGEASIDGHRKMTRLEPMNGQPVHDMLQRLSPSPLKNSKAPLLCKNNSPLLQASEIADMILECLLSQCKPTPGSEGVASCLLDRTAWRYNKQVHQILRKPDLAAEEFQPQVDLLKTESSAFQVRNVFNRAHTASSTHNDDEDALKWHVLAHVVCAHALVDDKILVAELWSALTLGWYADVHNIPNKDSEHATVTLVVGSGRQVRVVQGHLNFRLNEVCIFKSDIKELDATLGDSADTFMQLVGWFLSEPLPENSQRE